MRQTLAILLDACRGLRSKWLFWISLWLSGLVVLCFLFLGIDERGLTIVVWHFDHPWLNTRNIEPATLYKWLFSNLGIGIWLSWVGTILALISTAGMFPDLVAGGSIDLMVSRPIGRLRLFFTQYAAGLLFVTLQATIFSAASFVVLGLRGGVWEPGLFVAVPVMVVFFSYLFSVCVLVGVRTRSTVAALLLTLLFWVGVWAVAASENTLLMFREMQAEGVAWTGPRGRPAADAAPTVPEPEPPASSDMAYTMVSTLHTVLPKTTETVDLLERWLIRLADLPDRKAAQSRQQEIAQATIESIRSRSPLWILGTSLGFEAVVLALAAWSFCRRDF